MLEYCNFYAALYCEIDSVYVIVLRFERFSVPALAPTLNRSSTSVHASSSRYIHLWSALSVALFRKINHCTISPITHECRCLEHCVLDLVRIWRGCKSSL